MFDSESLSKDFLEINTSLIGALLQKFTMYNIKSAILIKDVNSLKSKFKNSIVESRRQGIIKIFTNIADAEKWFLNLKQKGEL